MPCLEKVFCCFKIQNRDGQVFACVSLIITLIIFILSLILITVLLYTVTSSVDVLTIVIFVGVIISALTSFNNIISSILILSGLVKKNYQILFPWCICAGILIFGNVLIFLGAFIILFLYFQGYVFLGTSIFSGLCGIQLHLSLCVISFYQDNRDKEKIFKQFQHING